MGLSTDLYHSRAHCRRRALLRDRDAVYVTVPLRILPLLSPQQHIGPSALEDGNDFCSPTLRRLTKIIDRPLQRVRPALSDKCITDVDQILRVGVASARAVVRYRQEQRVLSTTLWCTRRCLRKCI